MITAAQAQKQLEQLTNEATAELEAKIDSALESYAGSNVRVDCSTTRRVVLAVAQKYREEGGWVVEVVWPSQRSTDTTLTFSVPKTNPAKKVCVRCGAVEGDGKAGCLETEPPQHNDPVHGYWTPE